MKNEDVAWLDYETEAIRDRPRYPPKPVGFSLKLPNEDLNYYAFGHPTKNNCTFEEAKRILENVWKSNLRIGCFHAKFDLCVANAHFGLAVPEWFRIEDPLYLMFLNDPHSDSLSLKPAAAKLLRMPPDEQEAVRDWLLAHQEQLRSEGFLPADVKLSTGLSAKDSPSGEPQYWAAWICLAPGDLVGAYADGDVIRTEKLFEKLMPSIIERGMGDAYARERKLIPILLEMEKQGIRVDLDRLWNDVQSYEDVLAKIDRWLRERIGVDADFNLGAGQQLVRAMAEKGLLDLQLLGTTLKSKPEKPTYKSDKESLKAAVSDAQLSGVLQYQSQLETCMNTFMKSWLNTAMQSDGLIFTQWNQVRTDEFGARTGRFSSSPNFQNIPQEFKPIFQEDIAELTHEDRLTTQQYSDRNKLLVSLPHIPFDLPKLPLVRSYIIPFRDGDILIDRDFSSQEPRIFGHFEDGPLLKAYQENPWLDLHDHATEIINGMLNTQFKRKQIKQIVLGLLYGMGIKLLAIKAGVSEVEARTLKQAVLRIFPGLQAINDDMKRRAQGGFPLRTWGGREYLCEAPKIINGRQVTFEYKLINVLIQGSAADVTKDALIDYWGRKDPRTKLLLTVHDELLASTLPKIMVSEMEVLRVAMEGIDLDVAMKSEGTTSLTNWAEMVAFDHRGVRV